MERKNAVAVITARGGSKRIPHKNIKEFCGRPIIEYSIEAALKSGVFDEVMVSMTGRLPRLQNVQGQQSRFTVLRKQPEIMRRRTKSFWKCWKSMKNVERHLRRCAVFIRRHRF